MNNYWSLDKYDTVCGSRLSWPVPSKETNSKLQILRLWHNVF